MFRNISKAEAVSGGYVYLDSSRKFRMRVPEDPESNILAGEVVSQRFTVTEHFSSMQLKVEIFYDPSFFDLELSLHPLYSSSPVTPGKGLSRLFVEVEPGQEYELHINYIVPQLSGYSATCLEFGLEILFADTILKQHTKLPHIVTAPLIHCAACLFETHVTPFKVLYLTTPGPLVADLHAHGLTLVLEEVSSADLSAHDYRDAFETALDPALQRLSSESHHIRAELLPGRTYRLILQVDETVNPSDVVVFTLRVEIGRVTSLRGAAGLPASLDEVKRTKTKSEGLSDREYLIGSSKLIQMLSDDGEI